VDEIEKMPKRDQNMLLNLLETGMLISTKVEGFKRWNLKVSNCLQQVTI
jgi:hypothetical protein